VEGFNSIIYGGQINVVLLEGNDVKIACELIRSGWNDVFDNSMQQRRDLKLGYEASIKNSRIFSEITDMIMSFSSVMKRLLNDLT